MRSSVRMFVLALLLSAVSIPLMPGARGEDQSSPKHDDTGTAGPHRRVFEVCELYALGHFGNSYEVMGPNEMREMLKEAAYWGFNRYGDWFDSDNCKDPFDPNHAYDLGNAMWDYKKIHFASAQARGLAVDMVVTPNHVYLEQCTPDLLATKETGGKGQMIMGQLICPSKPKARVIILKNCENLFAIHREIGTGTEWTPKRLAAVDRFWAVVEQLEREVWGIAHLRHTLGRSYTRVPCAGPASFGSFRAGPSPPSISRQAYRPIR